MHARTCTSTQYITHHAEPFGVDGPEGHRIDPKQVFKIGAPFFAAQDGPVAHEDAKIILHGKAALPAVIRNIFE